MQKEKTYIVSEKEQNQRLDIFLALAQSKLSRTRIKQLILQGAVLVNKVTICEPKYKVKPKDKIILFSPEPIDPEPKGENIELNIIYEDEEIIVIDKPAGLVVHPAPGHSSGTLVNALIHHCGEQLLGIGGVKRPGIVHRLDKDSSGIMVVAKTQYAHNNLSEQFADHGKKGVLKRSYIAYCWGGVMQNSGTINMPIGRDKYNRLKQAVRNDGKKAITHYEIINKYGEKNWQISKIKCTLQTGRTHQIRVHMANIKHPLLADSLYGGGFATKVRKLPNNLANIINSLNGQALHAALLAFAHPKSNKLMIFEAELPGPLKKLDLALAPYS